MEAGLAATTKTRTTTCLDSEDGDYTPPPVGIEREHSSRSNEMNSKSALRSKTIPLPTMTLRQPWYE